MVVEGSRDRPVGGGLSEDFEIAKESNSSKAKISALKPFFTGEHAFPPSDLVRRREVCLEK